MRKTIGMVALGIIAVLMVGIAAGFAEETVVTQPKTTGSGMGHKLFRGIANAATGWLEIPNQMSDSWKADGPGAGLTWGFVKGIGFAVARSVIGAYEIITFPVPVPARYAPVMEPEFVVEDL